MCVGSSPTLSTNGEDMIDFEDEDDEDLDWDIFLDCLEPYVIEEMWEESNP